MKSKRTKGQKGHWSVVVCRRNVSVWLDRVVDELREWVEWIGGGVGGVSVVSVVSVVEEKMLGWAGEVGLG